MKYILSILFSALLSFSALAQGSGQLQPGQVWGNPTAAPKSATGASVGAMIDRSICSTPNNLLLRGGALWACVASSGTGNVAMTTSPLFTTPSLGAATASSIVVSGAATASSLVVNGGGSGATAGISSQGTSVQGAGYNWKVTDGAADQKYWDAYATGTTLNFRAVNDANNFATNWATVNRGAATAITNVTFPNPTVLAGALTYGGVTLSNSVTGTGPMVLGTGPTIGSPTITGPTITGSFTATGLVTNAALTNPSTTVNGTTCTLGSTCTVTTATGRTVLTGNTTYYIGANLGAVTISIASPAVAGITAHGLQIGDQVVFQVPQNRTACTVTAASPAVVSMTNTFAAGQPISILSTGTLPGALTQGPTNYVIAAGLSGSQFELSATVGGAAINTPALTNTFVNGNTTVTSSAAHHMVVGQRFQFAGTSVVNVSNGVDYFVLSAGTASTFTFSLTNGGTVVTPGVVTTQGTLAQIGPHYCSTVGALPTPIVEGQVYFVIAAGFGANSFQFSTTLGGSAVNTSGTVTGSPIYTVYTGSDTNNGSAPTRAAAYLTINKAANVAYATLDTGGYQPTFQLSNGTFLGASSLLPIVGQRCGANPAALSNPIIQGNVTTPSNVVLTSASGSTISLVGNVCWNMQGVQLTNTDGAGSGCVVIDQGSWMRAQNVEFGSCNGAGGNQIIYENNSGYETSGPYLIFAGASSHAFGTFLGLYQTQNGIGTLLNVPNFGGGFAFNSRGAISNWIGASWVGSATGGRYFGLTGGGAETNTSCNQFFLPGNSFLGFTPPAWCS